MIDNRFFIYVHRRSDTGEVFYVGKGTWTPLKKYVRSNATSKRNFHWKRVVAKSGGFTSEVVAEFSMEADAFNEEVRLIALYGKSNSGGILCNMTDGGEGHSGLSPSQETRTKVASALSGKPKTQHVKDSVSRAQRGVPNPEWQNKEHSIRMTGAGNPNFGTKNSKETIAKRVATRGDKCSGVNHPFFGKKRPQHVVDILREKQSRPVIDRATGARYATVGAAAAAFGKSITTVCRWLNGKRRNPTLLEYA